MDALKKALMNRRMKNVKFEDYEDPPMADDIDVDELKASEKDPKSMDLAPEIKATSESGEETSLEVDTEDGQAAVEIEKKIPMPMGSDLAIEDLAKMFDERDMGKAGFMAKASKKIKEALDKKRG